MRVLSCKLSGLSFGGRITQSSPRPGRVNARRPLQKQEKPREKSPQGRARKRRGPALHYISMAMSGMSIGYGGMSTGGGLRTTTGWCGRLSGGWSISGGTRRTMSRARLCGVCAEATAKSRGVVSGGRGAGVLAGCGECADVYEPAGIGLGREQRCACTVFSGEEDWAGGADFAELECEVAWTGGAVPLAAANGISALKMSFAVPRPADGERTWRADQLVGPNIGLTLQANRQAGEGCTRALFDMVGQRGTDRLGYFRGRAIGCRWEYTRCVHDRRVRAGGFSCVPRILRTWLSQGMTTNHVWEGCGTR